LPSYRFTQKAREGLRGIIDYVEAQFGDEVVDQVLSRLVSTFELLAANPAAGHRREDLTADAHVRFWSEGPSLIAYRPGKREGIEILIIERGEKDWTRLLEQDEG
jgi:plasmid stabilization system protein ParE